MLEGLADYSLVFTEPEPSSDAQIYQLVARPVLLDRIRQLQEYDLVAEWTRERLRRGDVVDDWTLDQNQQYLLFGGCLYVPEACRDEILQAFHNSQFAVHPGSTKMYRDLMR